jgi:DNA repair protein SbcC/Rad50
VRFAVPSFPHSNPPTLPMKLFSRLRKPAWENPDAAVRLRAVQTGQQPDLVARLAELAQRDPDPEVRIAALKRVDDLALLERRMRGEHDERVAAAARDGLVEQLCNTARAIDERLAVLATVNDPSALAAVAERAPDGALRRDALARIDRPGFLFVRCLQDPDPALRLWLLERIDSPDALQRLAEAARKRDKKLTRAARERLAALQLAAGDSAALQRGVLALCDQLERLVRELPADRDARLATMRGQWQELAPQVDADLQRRTEGYFAMAETAIAAAQAGPVAVMPAPTADADAPVAIEPAPPSPPSPPDPELDALFDALPAADADDFERRTGDIVQQAQQRRLARPDDAVVEAQFERLQAALSERRANRREARERQREQAVVAAAAALDALETELQAGNLTAARAARQALDGVDLPAALQRRLSRADQQLAKFDRWQRWSGHTVRQRLCEDAEALHGSGLHPDALATRVKELQAEWSRLDALEGEAAPVSDSGIARRFRALCQRALAPARGYFEKRRELRGQRAEQVEQLLEESADLISAANASAGALAAMRRRLGDALHGLDDVSPEKRAVQGRALRERRTEIDAALSACREQAAAEKRRLIARLRRELGQVDGAAGIALARQAQTEWKRLPRAERAEEDALWSELRGLVDPLFERVREQDTAQRAEQTANASATRAVLDELNALAAAGSERLQHAEVHVEGLITRFRALTRPVADDRNPHEGRDAGPARREGRDSGPARRDRPRGAPPRRPAAHPLEAEFNAALGRVDAARKQAAAELEQQSMTRIAEAGALLDRLQAADGDARAELRQAFDRLQLSADARQALQPRLAEIDAGHTSEVADPAAADLLAVRAELAAGIDSPAAAAALRRQEQMRRLASKLEGGLPQSPGDEIRNALIDLQALAGLPPADRDALQQRILAAYQASKGARPG